MKRYLLLWPFLAFTAPVAAQHIEIQARAGVGLSRFGGPDAQSSSFISYSDTPGAGSVGNPYGSRWGTGVALGARAERVGTSNGLLAFDLGYEWLQSRTNIRALYQSYPAVTGFTGPSVADGRVALQTHSLTAFLGIGHRFTAGKLRVDALAGPEAAYVFGFREKGSGTYSGTAYWNISQDHRAASRFDARLRADATVWYQRLGFNASYSLGFLNYQRDLVGASRHTYARALRLGLAYRLR